MLPFKLVYSDRYFLPIGAHVFPAEKYRLIHARLKELGLAADEDFVEPDAAADEDVLLVHTPEYVSKLLSGTITARDEMLLEVPYSRELVQAFWFAAGGSMLAARLALEHGFSANIGGGFHHAMPNHGEGFCMIHDVAVAIRRLQKDGLIQKAMTVDCDVHQGNGTAVIFGAAAVHTAGGAVREEAVVREGDASDVFTISLHQANNYPSWKPPSSLDVDLPDGTGDEQYLAWLKHALDTAFAKFRPDLICYIAGADPYRHDLLGGLNLTIDGLKQRDEMVLRHARELCIPVMTTFAGGYASNVNDTVTIHCNTIGVAKSVFA